jgi:hypothetical protein
MLARGRCIMLDGDGCRRLVSAALLRAARDVQQGRPCNGECGGGAHACADDARVWLAGDTARGWLDAVLDISPEVVKEWAAKSAS